MQSGGTGTIDSFKSALKELINIKNKVSNIEEGATKTIVVDNITTDSSTSALSARQGVVLDNEITSTRNDLLSEMKDNDIHIPLILLNQSNYTGFYKQIIDKKIEHYGDIEASTEKFRR